MCVLLVEDDPTILLWVSESLRDAGHEVMTAADGPEAFALIEQWPGHFSVLVTDYTMPRGVTGADIVVRMRESFPAIPMVIATAALGAVSGEFQQRHRVHVLPKPYETQELVTIVGGLLAA
jgi:CheY-like chemotaxis protein